EERPDRSGISDLGLDLVPLIGRSLAIIVPVHACRFHGLFFLLIRYLGLARPLSARQDPPHDPTWGLRSHDTTQAAAASGLHPGFVPASARLRLRASRSEASPQCFQY